MTKYYIYNDGTPFKFYDSLEECKKIIEERENSYNHAGIFNRYEDDLDYLSRINLNPTICKELKWYELINKKNEIRYSLSYQISYGTKGKRKLQASAHWCIKTVEIQG